MSKLEGGCMCGQVRYDCAAEPLMTAVCHCPDCQRQTGTAFSIVVGVPAEALGLNGEVTVYTTIGDSGAKVHRHFCGQCGSPIYSLPEAMAGLIFVKAGTLDDTTWLKPELEMFCDTAQSWCDLGGSWDKIERNPPLA